MCHTASRYHNTFFCVWFSCLIFGCLSAQHGSPSVRNDCKTAPESLYSVSFCDCGSPCACFYAVHLLLSYLHEGSKSHVFVFVVGCCPCSRLGVDSGQTKKVNVMSFSCLDPWLGTLWPSCDGSYTFEPGCPHFRLSFLVHWISVASAPFLFYHGFTVSHLSQAPLTDPRPVALLTSSLKSNLLFALLARQ